MNKSKKTRQQIKDEQINYLLRDVEKTLENYRQNIQLKEKKLSDSKKILLSAKQSYNKIVAENKELKAYIESLKQHFIVMIILVYSRLDHKNYLTFMSSQ